MKSTLLALLLSGSNAQHTAHRHKLRVSPTGVIEIVHQKKYDPNFSFMEVEKHKEMHRQMAGTLHKDSDAPQNAQQADRSRELLMQNSQMSMPVPTIPEAIASNPFKKKMVTRGGVCNNAINDIYASGMCSTNTPPMPDNFYSSQFKNCLKTIKSSPLCTNEDCKSFTCSDGWLDGLPAPYKNYKAGCQCGWTMADWLLVGGIIFGGVAIIAGIAIFFTMRKSTMGSAPSGEYYGEGYEEGYAEGEYAEGQYAEQGEGYAEQGYSEQQY